EVCSFFYVGNVLDDKAHAIFFLDNVKTSLGIFLKALEKLLETLSVEFFAQFGIVFGTFYPHSAGTYPHFGDKQAGSKELDNGRCNEVLGGLGQVTETVFYFLPPVVDFFQLFSTGQFAVEIEAFNIIADVFTFYQGRVIKFYL